MDPFSDSMLRSRSAPSPVAVPLVRLAVTPRVEPAKPLPETDGAAEAEMHQGQDLQRAGDISGAILSFRRAVSLSPLAERFHDRSQPVPFGLQRSDLDESREIRPLLADELI